MHFYVYLEDFSSIFQILSDRAQVENICQKLFSSSRSKHAKTCETAVPAGLEWVNLYMTLMIAYEVKNSAIVPLFVLFGNCTFLSNFDNFYLGF